MDKEIERTKDKLKKDCENEIDQAEMMKVIIISLSNNFIFFFNEPFK